MFKKKIFFLGPENMLEALAGPEWLGGSTGTIPIPYARQRYRSFLLGHTVN